MTRSTPAATDTDKLDAADGLKQAVSEQSTTIGDVVEALVRVVVGQSGADGVLVAGAAVADPDELCGHGVTCFLRRWAR